MVDLSDKGSESEEISSQTPTPDRVSSDGSNLKTCVDCGTSRTPLWRGGPAGGRKFDSLCNACGIRSRKKRRALMGVTKEEKKTKKSKNLVPQAHSCNSSTNSSGDSTTTKIEDSLKKKLWALNREVSLQRPRSNTTQRRKMGEVERAAYLLMALSYGSVYA